MGDMGDPLLECRRAAIAEGSSATAPLEFSTSGSTAVVVGGPSVLSKAAMGLVPIRSGALRVRGWSAVDSVQRGVAAGVPCDLVVPRNWTLRRMLLESAQLSGLALEDAQHRAINVAEALLLVPLLDRSYAQSPLVMKRAASLASGLVTRCGVLMIEDLFDGLTFVEAENFGDAMVRALDGREWVLFCSRFRQNHPLAPHADEVITLRPGKPALSSPPPELPVAKAQRSLRIRLRGNVDKFVDDAPGAGIALLARDGDQLFVALGERQSSDLFALALASGALITELAPADTALA